MKQYLGKISGKLLGCFFFIGSFILYLRVAGGSVPSIRRRFWRKRGYGAAVHPAVAARMLYPGLMLEIREEEQILWKNGM